MNDYKYWLIYATLEGIAEAESKGFTRGSFSSDGIFMIVDKADTEHQAWINGVTIKPSYVVEEFDMLPMLTHEQARILRDYQCSALGSSDGWTFTED